MYQQAVLFFIGAEPPGTVPMAILLTAVPPRGGSLPFYIFAPAEGGRSPISAEKPGQQY